MNEQKQVPYFTSDDDESQWCGHVWRQREYMAGRWGYAWEVIPPCGTESVSSGWGATQEEAERRMNESLERHAGVKPEDLL